MKKLGYLEIREKYLSFMKKNGHAILPSASIVPENDPTVLFANAGMFPLVPFLLGEKHPEGTRLANSQRCIRTVDIDEVGDLVHLTAFEMLGNWSLNDYFKDEAISLTIRFLVEELGFDINKIYGSVFEGNNDAPVDDEAIKVWQKIFKGYGIEAKFGANERIQPFNKKENWWELAGGGPCGPDAEIFIDTGKEPSVENSNLSTDGIKYIELGNNVFMQYLKDGDNYTPLGKHNVDFGGGLDRWAMILQGKDSVWEIDIYKPIMEKIEELSTNSDEIKSKRIVVDHIKAATWIIADGVLPGRTEREYILRRLIRRAVRHGRVLGIKGEFTRVIGDLALTQFAPIYDVLESDREQILNILEEEEKKFNKTLEKGLREVEKLVEEVSDKSFKNLKGESFKLFETYGFPPELLIEELEKLEIDVDKDQFWSAHEKAFKAHQDKSRSASKGMFKGGLADSSEESTKLHTATHLLLAALYKVLGDHIFQKGSNITAERLRLDFPNEAKLTPEQVLEVEDLVNEQIEKALPIDFIEMPKDDALTKVPYAAFSEKYSDIVKVYTIGEGDDIFSVEICNGPHVDNTSKLGTFKITKQKNVGAEVKRIKAVIE